MISKFRTLILKTLSLSHEYTTCLIALIRSSSDLLKNESLNESVAGDIIWEKVRDVIREKIETEIIDNLAMVIQTEVPEYNPDWCAESSNQSQWAADKLAEELATELMFELE